MTAAAISVMAAMMAVGAFVAVRAAWRGGCDGGKDGKLFDDFAAAAGFADDGRSGARDEFFKMAAAVAAFVFIDRHGSAPVDGDFPIRSKNTPGKRICQAGSLILPSPLSWETSSRSGAPPPEASAAA